MIENLVIVESPAKAKTIEKFLGNGYTVKSSFGHIRDLEKKDLGVDIEHNFQPKYEISSDKKTIVKELKTLAKESMLSKNNNITGFAELSKPSNMLN